MDVELPDGTVIEGVPDGTTKAQLVGKLKSNGYDTSWYASDVAPENRADYQYSPTSGMGAGEKFLAGAGKAFVDLGRGAGQALGMVSRQDVADSRQTDAPLMQSGWAKTGNFAGNAAAMIPATAIPGANTVAGAGLLGSAMGFLQPSASTKETITNTVLGGALSAGGQALGNKLASAASAKSAARTEAASLEQSQNSVRDQVLQEARDAGYVVPPTAVKANATNTALESISGKAATRQAMSAQNAKVTNELVRGDLGIANNSPITKGALAGVRQEAGKAYGSVRNALGTFQSDAEYKAAVDGLKQVTSDLEAAYPGIGSQASPDIDALVNALNVDGHNGAAAVNLSRTLRNRATANFKAAFGAGGNPEKLAIAKAQSQAAGAVEDLIARTLEKSGQGDLATAWDAARTTIAKSHQVEAALKGNNVSAVKLAAQLEKGRPVSGGMGLAARFASHFDDVAKVPKSGAGVGKLAATIAGGGTIGATAIGGPAAGAAMLGASVAPYAVRKGLLSGVGQNMLAVPNYAPGATGTLGLNALQVLGRGGMPLAYGANALIRPAQ